MSTGVFFLLRSAFVEVAKEHSGSTAEIINRSIEKIMVNGRADITEKMVGDLRLMTGVERLDVIDSEGREAFLKDSPPVEKEALGRLRESEEAFSVHRDGNLIFYRPLLNGPDCRECHKSEERLLGATKVTVSLEKSMENGFRLILYAFFCSLAGVAVMGFLFWFVVRRLIVLPVRRIQEAARALAEGDLTVDAAVNSRDEIGKLWASLQESLRTLSGLIARINEVSSRVARVSDTIEKESAAVVEATGVEAESFTNISVSMEELNASIHEIARGLIDLAASADSAHAAMREMAATVAEVAGSTEELARAVSETSSTTGEMSHTIRELSWGAEHLSEVSRQTVTAVHSMESYVKDVVRDAEESAAFSGKVTEEAEELGMKAVQRTLSGMEQIHNAVKKASEYVSSLGGRSKQIGAIVDVIDGVTDQTSLLALNAAILAAQAGENGKGFQVVAAEIRKLAVKTGGSTVEITELIKNVQAEVAGAVEAMGEGLKKIEGGFAYARESGVILEKIVASSKISMEKAASIRASSAKQFESLNGVKDVAERLDQMAAFLAQGTAEQKREADIISQSTDQILEAINHIRVATEEQTTASRHIEKAIESVSDGTRQMSRALQDEKEGSEQVMQALNKVVDLPGKTRGLARQINQGLRGVLSDTDLLREEVQSFKVLEEGTAGVMRLGVVPLESPAEMYRRFSPLAVYFSRLLGRTVKPKVALDFAEAINDLGEGRTQVAYLTPSTYVIARKKYGVVLLAKALRGGKPFQHSVIVTRKESGIGSIDEIRGHSFAFGDSNSTSSHIVPRAMLQERGISLDALSMYEYLGHHDDVARAVLKGEYDAGALMESVAFQHRDRGLVVLATSPPVPEFNLCASPALPEREREILARGLIDLSVDDGEGKSILSSIYEDYSGFTAAADSDYGEIREMMEKIALPES